MIQKYKITYRAVKRECEIELDAFSKYDAKQRFYRTYPKYEIIKIEKKEKENENKNGV